MDSRRKPAYLTAVSYYLQNPEDEAMRMAAYRLLEEYVAQNPGDEEAQDLFYKYSEARWEGDWIKQLNYPVY
jgi:hypothetical protein